MNHGHHANLIYNEGKLKVSFDYIDSIDAESK